MTEVNNTLQQLVFGDRNIFIFQGKDSEQADNIIDKLEVTKFLFDLDQKDYAITNPIHVMNMPTSSFARFKEELINLFDANTKEGLIFRKTFASEENLLPYTDEEWGAILAQYAITYGWTEQYDDHFGITAEDVLNDYVGSLDLTTIHNVNNGKVKEFTIGGSTTLVTVLRNILQSKTVLRAQQLATLNNAPIPLLAFAAKHANITIKEILVHVAILLLNEKLDYPLLRTPTDVVRFVAAHLTKDNSFEGQLTKAELAKLKLHIPTSMRKMLLNNMELIAYTNGGNIKGVRYVCEDMIKFENFWKRLNKFLSYEPIKNKRRKYPQYTTAIDLLYSDDRAWTFNSRYEEAKKRGDYALAISVMTEKPTLLLRNLLEFMRMTTGTEFPKKETGGYGVTMRKPRNAFTDALDENKPIMAGKVQAIIDTVQTDATDYLSGESFEKLLKEKANRKVLWQIVEQLHDESIYEPRFKRTTHEKVVTYTVPIPAMNRALAQTMIAKVLTILRFKTEDKKVFIDPSATGYKLQYSGRKSTDISFAGEFVTPGTELSLTALFANKNIEEPLLRLGVMWRGQSMDIDHSITTSRGDVVYYGNPELELHNKLIITSSGDITNCSKSTFSTELIDIDIAKIDSKVITEMFNNFIVYSGGRSIGTVECYTFFSIIDKKERVLSGQRAIIDLAKQDYAIRIDPENTDNTGSYIGCTINLKKGFIKVHALPVKREGGNYSNARLQYKQMLSVIAAAPATKRLTLDYAFKSIFDVVKSPEEADIILTKTACDETWAKDNNIVVLHPGRDSEQIQKLLF